MVDGWSTNLMTSGVSACAASGATAAIRRAIRLCLTCISDSRLWVRFSFMSNAFDLRPGSGPGCGTGENSPGARNRSHLRVDGADPEARRRSKTASADTMRFDVAKRRCGGAKCGRTRVCVNLQPPIGLSDYPNQEL